MTDVLGFPWNSKADRYLMPRQSTRGFGAVMHALDHIDAALEAHPVEEMDDRSLFCGATRATEAEALMTRIEDDRSILTRIGGTTFSLEAQLRHIRHPFDLDGKGIDACSDPHVAMRRFATFLRLHAEAAAAQQPPEPAEELSEVDELLSDIADPGFASQFGTLRRQAALLLARSPIDMSTGKTAIRVGMPWSPTTYAVLLRQAGLPPTVAIGDPRSPGGIPTTLTLRIESNETHVSMRIAPASIIVHPINPIERLRLLAQAS